jgi:hypothetical protein
MLVSVDVDMLVDDLSCTERPQASLFLLLHVFAAFLFSLWGTSMVYMYRGESFFASVLSNKCDNEYYYYSHHHSLVLYWLVCLCMLDKLDDAAWLLKEVKRE